MRIKRRFIMTLLLLVTVNCFCGDAISAYEIDTPDSTASIQRATGRFTMNITSGRTMLADTSFPLEVGETVTINATYSPEPASVDFGLVDNDGIFHSVNVTDGNIDYTIRITERGNYTFAVRNNSSTTITVTGFVQY